MIFIARKGHSSFKNHPIRRHLVAVGEVTTVAVGEVACEVITAGTAGRSSEDWGTRGDVVLLLETAVEEVDVEEGVISVVATWELDAFGLGERGTTVTGDDGVGAHGVELTAAYQDTVSECER